MFDHHTCIHVTLLFFMHALFWDTNAHCNWTSPWVAICMLARCCVPCIAVNMFLHPCIHAGSDSIDLALSSWDTNAQLNLPTNSYMHARTILCLMHCCKRILHPSMACIYAGSDSIDLAHVIQFTYIRTQWHTIVPLDSLPCGLSDNFKFSF